MQFTQRFADLPEYAFPRLRRLLEGCAPGGPDLAMTIGEPRHALPDMIARVVAEHAHEFALYPPSEGLGDLRAAIGDWLGRRYGVPLDPDASVLPLNGTREGLFNAALALSPERRGTAQAAVLMPNPFYQAYGAAALAAGAEPVFVPATQATGFLPDYGALGAGLLDRMSLCYVCSPLQRAAAALWRDEAHVAASRARYVAKFEIADRILGDTPGYLSPQAGFFLWLAVGDGEAAARTLYRASGVRVLPGGYLGRETAMGNPGADYIRVALVADETEITRGLTAIREVLFADARMQGVG